MRETSEFMQDFMSNLDADCYGKDYLINEGPDLSDEFVEEKLCQFEQMLQNEILDCMMDY